MQNSAITHYAISCNIMMYRDTEEVIYRYTQNVYRCISSIHWTQQKLAIILNYIVHKVNLSIDKADGSLYMYHI